MADGFLQVPLQTPNNKRPSIFDSDDSITKPSISDGRIKPPILGKAPVSGPGSFLQQRQETTVDGQSAVRVVVNNRESVSGRLFEIDTRQNQQELFTLSGIMRQKAESQSDQKLPVSFPQSLMGQSRNPNMPRWGQQVAPQNDFQASLAPERTSAILPLTPSKIGSGLLTAQLPKASAEFTPNVFQKIKVLEDDLLRLQEIVEAKDREIRYLQAQIDTSPTTLLQKMTSMEDELRRLTRENVELRERLRRSEGKNSGKPVEADPFALTQAEARIAELEQANRALAEKYANYKQIANNGTFDDIEKLNERITGLERRLKEMKRTNERLQAMSEK